MCGMTGNTGCVGTDFYESWVMGDVLSHRTVGVPMGVLCELGCHRIAQLTNYLLVL